MGILSLLLGSSTGKKPKWAYVPKRFYFKDPLEDFVVIDVETTGLKPLADGITQVAAVRFINHKETEFFSSYVNPEKHIPDFITKKTHISDQTVQYAPVFQDIWLEYKAFIEASPVVIGYNVGFDVNFLQVGSGEPLRDVWKCVDALPAAKKALPSLAKHTLSDVCQYIGYRGNFHNALFDCRGCGTVVNFLCEEYTNAKPMPLSYL